MYFADPLAQAGCSIYWFYFINIIFNPSPAEPGYVLPLQTV